MIDLLQNRRSIRKYKDKVVEREKIDKILKAGILAPTSKNLKSWEFIAVDDRDLLRELAKSRDNGAAKFLSDSPLGIVVVGDEEKSGAWIEDACIAGAFMQLEVEFLELGSCWIQVRDRMYSETETSEEFIKDLLKIGYPDGIKKGYKDSDLRFEKIHFNKL